MGCIAPALALAALVLSAAPAHASASLYADHCAQCHGADGRADTPVAKALKAPALLDPKWDSMDAADFAERIASYPAHAPLVGLDVEQLGAILLELRKLSADAD